MAFDFSKPRWQADCRELSNDEKDAFLLAIRECFPKLRWCNEDEIIKGQINNHSFLIRGTIDHRDVLSMDVGVRSFTDVIATASDIREFIAATNKPAAQVSEIDATLAQRGERYGKFNEFSAICQQLKNTAHSAPKWAVMPDDCREAVDMILHKVARALNGDPNYADNWHDIQGYAKLVEDRINGVQK